MKKRSRVRAKKKLDYPEETAGSRLAAEIRQRANKLAKEEREYHFNRAMALSFTGTP